MLFIEYNPNDAKRRSNVVSGDREKHQQGHSRVPTAQDWEVLRGPFELLYREKHVSEVIQIIERDHGFRLT
jgi:hypothetical protein